MRLWSLNPAHLDSRGLVALWREGLLARTVLGGKTRGYRRHPQLDRFYEQEDPMAAIDCYLSRVLDEARARGYSFDISKIRYMKCGHEPMPVTDGQIEHEWAHLLHKLETRDPSKWRKERRRRPEPHGCFRTVAGPVATWERSRFEGSVNHITTR